MSNPHRITPEELLRRGGVFLGAAREWLKWKRCFGNGETVIFGSNEEIRPPLTARDVDDIAAHVAAALWPDGAPLSVMEAAKNVTLWHYGQAEGQGEGAEKDCVLVARRDWKALKTAVEAAPKALAKKVDAKERAEKIINDHFGQKLSYMESHVVKDAIEAQIREAVDSAMMKIADI